MDQWIQNESPQAAASSDEEPQPAFEQKDRRASIKAILGDNKLSSMDKQRTIQDLMDGRSRCTSCGSRRGSLSDSMKGSMCGGNVCSRRGSMTSGNGSSRRGSLGNSSTLDDSVCSFDANESVDSRRSSISGGMLKCGDDHSDNGNMMDIGANDDDSEDGMTMERGRPVCPHYNRNCTIISPCCGLPFGCRICHDDCPVLPFPYGTEIEEQVEPPEMQQEDDSNKNKKFERRNSEGNLDTGDHAYRSRRQSLPSLFSSSLASGGDDMHHNIDRFAIEEVICRECFTRQSSKTNNCINCNVQFGEYHCSICNLWMPNDASPYHCRDCGFCRIGGAQSFRHCHSCGMCIDIDMFDEHNCKIGKYLSNCPVCQEDLFSSRAPSHEMPCGHTIHWHCFEELISYDSRCPICKKTVDTYEQMAPTWRAMAISIALQPVPVEMTKVVNISCNDCEQSEADRRWHILGVQCKHCSSFNTNVDDIQFTAQEAVAYLDQAEEVNISQTAADAARQLESGQISSEVAREMERFRLMMEEGAIDIDMMDADDDSDNDSDENEDENENVAPGEVYNLDGMVPGGSRHRNSN